MNSKMKNILWISLCAPYDSVDHAGGQVHNYYLKKLHAQNEFNIKLISFCHPDEVPKLDYSNYGIDATIIPQETKGLKHIMWGISHLETRHNPWNRYANITFNYTAYMLKREIKKLQKLEYKPDVVILQWTQMVLFISYLKKVFPSARFICIEEDVSYLGVERIAKDKKTWINIHRFHHLKTMELCALKQADQIICSNKKDVDLLANDGIRGSIWSWCPYYNRLEDINNEFKAQNLLFFGAMKREANWRSAIWFIEKVMDKLDERFKFVIVGSNPPEILKKHAGKRVIITGFVDDIRPYFEDAMCLVVPLQMGAGIKIKVLEGMSSGVPVLANDIGIEGIPAMDGKEYLHCELPEDFIRMIRKLDSNRDFAAEVGSNGRKFVLSRFNYVEDTQKFINLVRSL